MGEFNYKLKVDVNPTSGKPGDIVAIRVVLADVTGQIKNVYLSVPQYGIWEVLKPSSQDTYSMSYTIPWNAPSGTYDVQIYATNPDGERGPSSSITFTVL